MTERNRRRQVVERARCRGRIEGEIRRREARLDSYGYRIAKVARRMDDGPKRQARRERLALARATYWQQRTAR